MHNKELSIYSSATCTRIVIAYTIQEAKKRREKHGEVPDRVDYKSMVKHSDLITQAPIDVFAQ